MPRVVLPAWDVRHVPIHLWGRGLPDGALDQLRRVASQPYVVEHVAAMPDLHVANGIAVGTVFATDDTVVPSALGGDLGCGMSAARFDYPAASLSALDLQRLITSMSRAIPVGDATQRGRVAPISDALLVPSLSTEALEHARDRLGPRHLGTLGGGNHFIELDRDGGGDLWLLVHSGSRGVGAAIAAHHQRAAQAGAFGNIPGLRCASEEGKACLADIHWAFQFARANRDALLTQAAALVTALTGQEPEERSRVDVHHNFVQREEHFGRALFVHRKGAIAAPLGERALIPGSMATASYIVEGKGEALSFRSASHGAGRVLTRREARERIRPERFIHSMRRVVFDVRKRASLVEEASAAYRDIGDVLEDEADLVRPLIRLEPIAVLKG
jgi:tRNA-splicing ligase RtcB (3'-phosphate/5'-hydroxy nucleic acid ligase)